MVLGKGVAGMTDLKAASVSDTSPSVMSVGNLVTRNGWLICDESTECSPVMRMTDGRFVYVVNRVKLLSSSTTLEIGRRV